GRAGAEARGEGGGRAGAAAETEAEQDGAGEQGGGGERGADLDDQVGALALAADLVDVEVAAVAGDLGAPAGAPAPPRGGAREGDPDAHRHERGGAEAEAGGPGDPQRAAQIGRARA